MGILSITRDWGSDPAIVRIQTSDSLATVATTGYLADQAATISAINNGTFQWVNSDTVLVVASDGWGLFTISTDQLSLNPFSSGGGSTVFSGIGPDLGGQGAGPLSFAVPGLLAFNPIVVSIFSSSNPVYVIQCRCTQDGVAEVTLNADPGLNLTLNYIATNT
jgi:hypothetical protein